MSNDTQGRATMKTLRIKLDRVCLFSCLCLFCYVYFAMTKYTDYSDVFATNKHIVIHILTQKQQRVLYSGQSKSNMADVLDLRMMM